MQNKFEDNGSKLSEPAVKKELSLTPWRFSFTLRDLWVILSILLALVSLGSVLFFGVDYRDLKSEFNKMQTDINDAKADLVFIRRTALELDSVMIAVQRMRQVFKSDYPRFYGTSLQQSLWSVVEKFSINCDPKEIVEIKHGLQIIREFFPDTNASTYENPEFRSLSKTFQILESIIDLQFQINDVKNVRKDSLGETGLDSVSLRKEAIRYKLVSLREDAEKGIDHEDHKQLKEWMIGIANLLIWRHIDQKNISYLDKAKQAFETGLSAKEISARYRLESELRTRLAIVFSEYSDLKIKEDRDPEGAEIQLQKAIDLLEKSVKEEQTWDCSIFNALADYNARKMLIKLLEKSSPEEKRISHEELDTLRRLQMRAEDYIKMAITREPTYTTYRVTLFELNCLRFAVWDSIGGKGDPTLTVNKLTAYLDDILELSYNPFYHEYLFGEEKEHRHSPMMRTLKKYNPDTFEKLREHAINFARNYCEWFQQ